MTKILARAAAALGGAGVMVALFGAGLAAADGNYNKYVGMTYADAANAISQSGGSYKIATRVGNLYGKVGNDRTRLSATEGNCRVTGSRTSPTSGEVLLDLRCDYEFALPGVSGASRSSPEGKAAYDKALQQAQEQQQQQQAAAEAAAAGEG